MSNSLEECQEKLSDAHSAGVADGFTAACLGCLGLLTAISPDYMLAHNYP